MRESVRIPSALLAAVDLNGPVDGVLLLKRTGISLAAWTRNPVATDVITVMAATLLGSVEAMMEAMGAPSPETVLVEAEARRIFAMRVDPHLALVLISTSGVGEPFLRQEAKRLIDRMSAAKATAAPRRSDEASKRLPAR